MQRKTVIPLCVRSFVYPGIYMECQAVMSGIARKRYHAWFDRKNNTTDRHYSPLLGKCCALVQLSHAGIHASMGVYFLH